MSDDPKALALFLFLAGWVALIFFVNPWLDNRGKTGLGALIMTLYAFAGALGAIFFALG